jgi:hypothetical protein
MAVALTAAITMSLALAVIAPVASAKNENNNGIANGTPMAHKHHLDQVRAATDAFHSLTAAQEANYNLEVADRDLITCIEDPKGSGAMGVHHVNLGLLVDGEIEATTPEALIYEPGPEGSNTLVAVEYIVFADAWHAKHKQAPKLFGQSFELVPEGNRYGLQPFYELHAWIWKNNPNGLFDDWNPRVSCQYSTPSQ